MKCKNPRCITKYGSKLRAHLQIVLQWKI
ncbi:MAG: hypothetical protein ACLS61_18320 [Ruminococcus sp.]